MIQCIFILSVTFIIEQGLSKKLNEMGCSFSLTTFLIEKGFQAKVHTGFIRLFQKTKTNLHDILTLFRNFKTMPQSDCSANCTVRINSRGLNNTWNTLQIEPTVEATLKIPYLLFHKKIKKDLEFFRFPGVLGPASIL